eukprot:TRINITY_DN6824_c0_g1_i3.p5 TRINITY_DN6824_c0_g1~~TRINITY_DN6824_c0_g1_i3.p5  ORF type:complete len:316 (-),score=84.18 TRINITY_DN6824_c0_g1_i3:296-1243(-)
MDCALVALPRHPDLFLIETTDFFYPLVDDPYLQGRIACCNVLSDQYAMGVVDCDNMLMLLACSTDMEARERDIVTTEMMRGFRDTCSEAETRVRGGQTVLNPWPIIGGVASSVCRRSEFITPDGIVPGDVLVLTKPLGTRVAVNAILWTKQAEKWSQISHVVSVADVERMYLDAKRSMATLNRNGARLMHKFGAHGATDITGFGLLGHVGNLAKHQKAAGLEFVIHTLPLLAKSKEIDDAVTNFKLQAGWSAETSGGLCVALPSQAAAEEFCRELELLDGSPAWIIGRVESAAGHGPNSAKIVPNPSVVSVFLGA